MAATTFTFAPKLVQMIDTLREDMHAGSRSEVLRRALALLKLLKDAEKNGAEILLKKDGTEQRVIIS